MILWRVVAAGRPALDFARIAADEYRKRLGRDLEIVYLRTDPEAKLADRYLQASEGCHRIALSPDGKQVSTTGLAQSLREFREVEARTAAFLIGPANGLPGPLRSHCQQEWSMSPWTLQHEVALVVLLEQLYRVKSIWNGSPYHR